MRIFNEKISAKLPEKKAPMKDYRKNPGNLDNAAYAALYAAKKIKNRIIVVPGNSYMNRVYHLAKDSDDLTAFTVMATIARVLVVYPDGQTYIADAMK